MIKLDKKLIVGFVIIILLWLIISPQISQIDQIDQTEMFDETGTVFVPVGCPRHSLTGERLRPVNISKYFLNPNRNIRLNSTGNWMYASNGGFQGCNKVGCPTNTDEYDKSDTCWRC